VDVMHGILSGIVAMGEPLWRAKGERGTGHAHQISPPPPT
jgi:hypothetical protein